MVITKARTINPKCRVCGVLLTEQNWYWYSNESRDHISLMCKTCWCQRKKDWNKNNPIIAKAMSHRGYIKHPDVKRNSNYKRKYGITLEEYNNILLKQDNKCAICGSESVGRKTDKYFVVDHDHKLNKVRGLLCDQCNKGLGHFKDLKENLLKAIKYLGDNENE